MLLGFVHFAYIVSASPLVKCQLILILRMKVLKRGAFDAILLAAILAVILGEIYLKQGALIKYESSLDLIASGLR